MNITILKIILSLLLFLFITIFLQTHETFIEGNIAGKGKKILGGGNKKKKKFFGGGNNKKGKGGGGGGGGGGDNEGTVVASVDHDHDDEYLRKGKAIKLGNLTCDEFEFSQEDGLSCSNVIVEGGDEVDDDD